MKKRLQKSKKCLKANINVYLKTLSENSCVYNILIWSKTYYFLNLKFILFEFNSLSFYFKNMKL